MWYQIKAFVNIYFCPFLPTIETALTGQRIKFEEKVSEYKLYQVKKYQSLKIIYNVHINTIARDMLYL